MGFFEFFKSKNNKTFNEHHFQNINDDIVKIDENGELRYVPNGAVKHGVFVVPKQVVTIGPFAFNHLNDLNKVVLHKDIEFIAPGAFEDCKNLKEIVGLEDCVKLRDLSGFYGCKSLKHVDVPENLGVFGEYAFCGCESLESVDVPLGCWGIGELAFCGCKSLQEIHLPPSMSIIGSQAFKDCDNLTIYLDTDQNYYGEINMCIDGENYSIPSGNILIKPGALGDAREVIVKDNDTLKKVINSGYDGIVSLNYPEHNSVVSINIHEMDEQMGNNYM